jgi:ABC-2 type transport system ATP-binding protein
MIVARELTKNYGWLKAVDDVNFEIAQGECVGLLGLNGAGKTTLLRILSTLLTPTSGKVTVDGTDVVRTPEEVRRRIGFLPEEPPLYGEMTVRNFLEFTARLRKVPGDQVADRVAEAGKRSQVEEVFDQHIETLSYGYKKRVGIAQAVIHRPPLVILDEPIAGLDPAQIVEMRDLVRGLRGEHTVVLSSHILTEISQTCDRILVMHRGRIVAAGSENQLLAGLGRGMRLSVQVAGTREQVEEVLQRVHGLKSFKIVREDDGVLDLEMNADSDQRVEVSRALVHGGLGLMGLARKDDIESIFLQLTGGREAES